MRIGALIVVLWLAIGAIAGGQRGYYSNSDTSCAKASTIVVTILGHETQVSHAALAENITRFNHALHGPGIPSIWNLSTNLGLAALNATVTKQAATIAYIRSSLPSRRCPSDGLRCASRTPLPIPHGSPRSRRRIA